MISRVVNYHRQPIKPTRKEQSTNDITAHIRDTTLRMPHKTHKPNAFELLGLDVLTEVVCYLDNYTIISLLEAFPPLKQYTILLTDHKFPAMFFSIKGIRRKLISTPVSRKMFRENVGEMFDPRSDREPIKLIEFCHEKSLKYLVQFYDGCNLLNVFQSPRVDACTFIFIRADSSDGREHHMLAQRLDEHTLAKWHCGSAVYFASQFLESKNLDPVNTLKYPKHFGMNPGMRIHGSLKTAPNLISVQTLRLENIPIIQNIYLPLLKSLSVIYTKRYTTRPIIRNVYAAQLVRFVVHFTHLIPDFQKLSQIGTRRASYTSDVLLGTIRRVDLGHPQVPNDVLRTFELAEKSCLQCNRGISPIEPGFLPDGEELDLSSFLERFAIVHLMGVPVNSLVKYSERNRWTDGVLKLRWNSYERIPELSVLTFKNLHTLVFGLYSRGSGFPRIKNSSSSLTHVYVFSMATDVDLSPLIPSIKTKDVVNTVCLYSSPRLARVDGWVYRMWYNDWKDVRVYGTDGLLSYVGHVIPMMSPQDRDVRSIGEDILQVALDTCKTVILRPLVFIGKETELKTVEVENFKFGGESYGGLNIGAVHGPARDDWWDWNRGDDEVQDVYFLPLFHGGKDGHVLKRLKFTDNNRVVGRNGRYRLMVDPGQFEEIGANLRFEPLKTEIVGDVPDNHKVALHRWEIRGYLWRWNEAGQENVYNGLDHTYLGPVYAPIEN